jgi:tetratricopeptide (TPR) repeat protein
MQASDLESTLLIGSLRRTGVDEAVVARIERALARSTTERNHRRLLERAGLEREPLEALLQDWLALEQLAPRLAEQLAKRPAAEAELAKALMIQGAVNPATLHAELRLGGAALERLAARGVVLPAALAPLTSAASAELAALARSLLAAVAPTARAANAVTVVANNDPPAVSERLAHDDDGDWHAVGSVPPFGICPRIVKRLVPSEHTTDDFQALRAALLAIQPLAGDELAVGRWIPDVQPPTLCFQLPPGALLAATNLPLVPAHALRAMRDVVQGLIKLAQAGYAPGYPAPSRVWLRENRSGALLLADAACIATAAAPEQLPPVQADLIYCGALLVLTQTGQLLDAASSSSALLAKMPPISRGIARRCLGGADAFTSLEALHDELVLLAPNATSRTPPSPSEDSQLATQTATTQSGSPAATRRRHRREPNRPAAHVQARATQPLWLAAGALLFAAICGWAMLRNNPAATEPTAKAANGSSTVNQPRFELATAERRQLRADLTHANVLAVRQLLETSRLSSEAAAAELLSALIALSPAELIALRRHDWPVLEQQLTLVFARPLIINNCRDAAAQSLARGDLSEARALVEVVAKGAAATTPLLEALIAPLPVTTLITLRRAAAEDWSELVAVIDSRYNSPAGRQQLASATVDLLRSGQFATARQLIGDDPTLGKQALAMLDLAALGTLIETCATEQSNDPLAQQAGLALATRDPQRAERLAAQYRNQAVELADDEQHQAAIVAWSCYIALRSDDYRGYGERGESYRFLMRYEEALADFQRTLVLRPGDPVAYNNRAIIYRDLERYQEALVDHKLALEGADTRNPQSINLRLNRMLTYLVIDQRDAARADLSLIRQTLDALPASSAVVARNKALIEPFLLCCELLIANELEPGDRARLAAALESRPGRLLVTFGQMRALARIADRLIVLLPEHPLGYLERAAIHLATRDAATALADVTEAAQRAQGPYAGYASLIEDLRQATLQRQTQR